MNVRAWVAEALGTFILVAFGSMAIVSAAGLGAQPNPAIILLVAPFGFGLGLLAAIAFLGHISGGHFNPAVTLGFLFDGRIDILNAVAYVVAQVVGAVAAGFAILLIVAKEAVPFTASAPGVPPIQAFGAEVVLSAVFVGVILTITRQQATHAPFVIALTLVGIHFAGIPISGASVNPARSLGPAIVAAQYKDLWVYLTAPFLGAIIGWAIYRFLTPPDDEISVEIDLDDEGLELAEIDELPNA